MSSLNIILVSVLSLVISVVIGKFLYKSDLPQSLIDIPNIRKVHNRPTPLVGGITIVFTLLIMVVFLTIYDNSDVQLYIIFSLYFFFIGLFDDLFRWNYKRKLFLQVIGTISFILSISDNISTLTFSSLNSNNLFFNQILIFIWMLFLINAFNFFDGINFLAGSLAIVFFTSYSIYFSQFDSYYSISILIILMFAVVGFLVYNRAPAKMFLGDAGSMFLGFTLATYPLVFSTNPTNELDLTFFIIVLFILVSDTFFVLVNRLLKNKNPFQPDKTHLHHLLLDLDFRNRYVVLIIVASAILHSILAFNSQKLSLFFIVLIITLLNFVFIIMPRYLPNVVSKYNLWNLKHTFDKIINKYQKDQI